MHVLFFYNKNCIFCCIVIVFVKLLLIIMLKWRHRGQKRISVGYHLLIGRQHYDNNWLRLQTDVLPP